MRPPYHPVMTQASGEILSTIVVVVDVESSTELVDQLGDASGGVPSGRVFHPSRVNRR